MGSIVSNATLLTCKPISPYFEPTMRKRLLPLWKLPSQCMICHAWPAQSICRTCQQAHAPRQLRCAGCALLLPPGQTVHPDGQVPLLCADCLRQPLSGIDACHAAVSYAWPWQQCVDGFKFGAQTGWADALAQLMLRHPQILQAIGTCDLLIPMPLHPLRLAERGFNQSLLLAKALRRNASKQLNLVSRQAALCADGLLRVRNTPAQSRLSLTARLRNMHQAFAVADASRLAGKHILLIDDVMTTGASIQAAAQALRHAHIAGLQVAVFARTEKG